MKVLIVESMGKIYKYPHLYTQFCFEKDPEGDLLITKLDQETKEETIHAVFRNWDYMWIEDRSSSG
jgi:hypothetical protein